MFFSFFFFSPLPDNIRFVSPLQDDIREEAIAALDDLMGEQGKQGLADLMTSLGIIKPLNTKEESVSELTCPPPPPSHVSSSDY